MRTYGPIFSIDRISTLSLFFCFSIGWPNVHSIDNNAFVVRYGVRRVKQFSEQSVLKSVWFGLAWSSASIESSLTCFVCIGCLWPWKYFHWLRPYHSNVVFRLLNDFDHMMNVNCLLHFYYCLLLSLLLLLQNHMHACTETASLGQWQYFCFRSVSWYCDAISTVHMKRLLIVRDFPPT